MTRERAFSSFCPHALWECKGRNLSLSTTEPDFISPEKKTGIEESEGSFSVSVRGQRLVNDSVPVSLLRQLAIRLKY